MKYRLEIQGLRAIAVLAVIVYHMQPSLLPGGYLGVNVFFVISGYLITNQLLIHRNFTGLAIQEYFKRRILRIAPALLVLSIVSWISSCFYLIPIELKTVSQSLGFSTIGLANFYFYWKSDYFEPSFEYQPLLHTWSLSLEEQFYFTLPLILLLRSSKTRYFLLILLTVLSFLLCLSLEEHAQRFYLLHARFWEFGLGSIAAFVKGKGRKKQMKPLSAFILMAFFMFGFVNLDQGYSLPGMGTLACTLPVAVLLVSNKLPAWMYCFLSARPLVLLGNLSYSLYLWHYPVREIFKLWNAGSWTWEQSFFYLLVVFCLSWLSYQWVEQPFRNYNRSGKKKLWFVLILAVVSFVLSFLGHFYKGFPQRMSAQSLAYDRAARELPPLRHECLSGFSKFVQAGDEHCIHYKDLPLNAIVWGDSHGEALTQGIANEFAKRGFATSQVTMGRCPPILGIETSHSTNDCSKYNQQALTYIQEQRVEWVVLVARWPFYFENNKGIYRYGRSLELYDATTSVDRTMASSSYIKAQIDKTVQKIQSQGTKVILVHPIVEYPWNVPMRLARLNHLGLLEESAYTIGFEEVTQRHELSNKLLEVGGSSAYLQFYPAKYQCAQERNICNPVQLNKSLYYDDDHLNRGGSLFLAEKILRELPTSAH